MKLLIPAAALALLATTSAAAADFVIDPVHSQIFFSASHDGYTYPWGRMHLKQGRFRFDDADWSQAQVDATIDIASLDMGDGAWNHKLLSSYFDVSNHPTARFVSKRVEKTGERTGIVHGELTLLGRTRPLDLQVTLNRAAVKLRRRRALRVALTMTYRPKTGEALTRVTTIRLRRRR